MTTVPAAVSRYVVYCSPFSRFLYGSKAPPEPAVAAITTLSVCGCLLVLRCVVLGSLALGSEPNPGSVTMLLPPLISTPGTAGFPAGLLPAPPGPFEGEIPLRAAGSEPCPAPAVAPPGAFPLRPLPGPLPREIAEPPPEPPNPGFSPPLGDIASEPVPPLVGTPTLVPG